MKERKKSRIRQDAIINASKPISPVSPVIDERLIPHLKDLCNLVLESITFHSIYAASKIGIADVLADKPKSVDDIAEETGNNADAIYRLMRALASIGIFQESSKRMFELTPKAELLKRNHQTSLLPLVLILGDPFVLGPRNNILYSIKTGESAFEHTFNKSAFEYMKDRDAMNDNGRLLVIDAVLEPGNERDINKFLDLYMLVGMPGGRERTEDEFRKLFARAGLELIRIIPTDTILSFSIVEGKRV